MITLRDLSASYSQFIAAAIENEYNQRHYMDKLINKAENLKNYIELFIDERREQ